MADIGTTLREARMRAQIDISEVEAQTKIRARYLRAIENEEWDLLPGSVYAKSFLKTYGEYLHLDSRRLVEEYKRQYEGPIDHEPRPGSPFGRERERKARRPLIPPGWAIVGVVLVAIVVALYLIGTSNNGHRSPTTPNAAAGAHRKRHHRRHPPPPRPTRVTLQLVPTGTVYVCLVDGTGKMLINGQIFGSGQSIPRETADKMLLTLGNNSVQMKVNGKPVTVAASGTSIGYMLKPSGASPLPAAQQPRCT